MVLRYDLLLNPTKIFKKPLVFIIFLKIQTCVFLQIPLNFDQHLNFNIFFSSFFFPKKIRGILGTPLKFNSKFERSTLKQGGPTAMVGGECPPKSF
jgi:hypothetical protein